MIKTYLITIVFAISSIWAAAQVNEKDMRMSEGVQNALVVELEGANKKKAENVWKNFAKEFGKIERNRKQKEYFIQDAIIPAIDQEYAVTVFTKFDEYDEYTRAYFWFKMDDRYLNSIDDEAEIDGADIFLRDYDIAVEKEVVKDELNGEEKVLRNLNKDLEKLEKNERNLYKDIEKAKDTIRKAEEELERNAEEQKEKKSEIGNQEEIVKMVSEKLNKVGKD